MGVWNLINLLHIMKIVLASCLLLFIGVSFAARKCEEFEECVPFKFCESAVAKLRAAHKAKKSVQRAAIAEIRQDICGAPRDRTLCCIVDRDEGATASKEVEEVFLGRLSNLIHDIAGDVYAVGRNQLLIRGFNYDDLGPDAFLFADTLTDSPNGRGTVVIPYPNEEKYYAYNDPDIPILPEFTREDVLVTLPPGVTVDRLTWLSVWCRRFDISFGHLLLK